MTKTELVETARKSRLDALARRVLDARAEFDEQLLGKKRRRFPVNEFEKLWCIFLDYWTAMRRLDWLHRDVAREIVGLCEYLALECYESPGEILAKADRMECMLFADRDPYFEGIEPPEPEDMARKAGDDFGIYEAECAACDSVLRVDGSGLCQACGSKLERDLIRKRDWAYSVSAYAMTDEQREDLRRQVVSKFGDRVELVATSKSDKPNQNQRKRR